MQNPAKEQQISSFSGSRWECDFETRKLGVRELLGDECLDLFMPVDARSGNHVSNNISTEKDNGIMRKLHSYAELVDKLKNDPSFVNSVDLQMNG